jgi:23S rRNA pseudouridine2605 synthase
MNHLLNRMKTIRLNKFLASCGVASRRAAENFIAAGRVTVNGRTVHELGTRVNPQGQKVCLDGKLLKPVSKKLYILLNKPKGYITTVKDEKGRRTIFSLVKIKERLFPVGRLDADSEGLLLLTNDGDMAHRLMHPKYKMIKTYRVKLNREFHLSDFDRLTAGVELDDGLTSPCRASFYTDSPDRIEIHVHEGRKRQIRRMFEALDYDVKTLKRVQMGPLRLTNEKRGEWRFLTKGEIKQLAQVTEHGRESEKAKS